MRADAEVPPSVGQNWDRANDHGLPNDSLHPESMIALRASDAPHAFGYTPGAAAASQSIENLELARRYLAAIEGRATGDTLAAFFAPDVEQIEFPNRLVPTGAHRNLAALLEGANRGQQILLEQRYQVDRAYCDGSVVVLEVVWVGVLRVALGSLPAGAEMIAHFAVFLEIEGGRIIRQRNYDCFDAF